MDGEQNVFDVEIPLTNPEQPPITPAPVASAPQEPQNDFYYQPKVKKTKKRKGTAKKILKVLLSALLIIALVVACCTATALYMNRLWEEKTEDYYLSANKSVAAMREEMAELEKEFASAQLPDAPAQNGLLTPAKVYENNVNAVVAISNQGLTTNIFGQTTEMASSGTGFIVSADGYVVSNYHVVAGATTLTVMTPDGKEYSAQVVGYDDSNDISVLKIEAENLPYVTLGNSDGLVVGDQVAAIGNPLGELTSTLTVGCVSAMDRTINTDGTSKNMLQTDAAINSGNSGGPLFNMKGEVVGITTAKYSGTSNSGATIEGIGFAIPINDVKDMIEDLLEFGYVKSAYLGVRVQDVPVTTAEQYGLPMGSLVVEVVEGGCAEKAGLQAKDIIVDIGGYPVRSVADLTRVLRNFEGGEETVITVYRSGAEKALPIVLDAKIQE